MHSAIAILKLFRYTKVEGYFRVALSDLKFSALLTVSILSHMLTEDEWYTWSEMVEELTNSIELNRDAALELLSCVDMYLKDG